MERIVGIQYITSKKNGLHYMKISALNDMIYNIPGEHIGQDVSEYFVCEEDIKSGEVELVGGKIELNAHIRVMKENKNGMDRVALIMVSNDVPAAGFVNSTSLDTDKKKSVAGK